MEIEIQKYGIIQKQSMTIGSDVTVIYGYNNSGKTTILKVIHKALNDDVLAAFLRGETRELSVYIPTNRVVTAEVNTEYQKPGDLEDFLRYQRESYQDYSLHLKTIRTILLAHETVKEFIRAKIKEIFDLEIDLAGVRYSDGIENIMNIYLDILWVMTWDRDISSFTMESLQQYISEKQVCVLIDEIEMFLHVKVQSRLIANLKRDFGNCSFVLTTHSPIILTRYRECIVYHIEGGRLEPMEEELFYEDLDHVYEELFWVEELPSELREDINYLGRTIMREVPYDRKRIDDIEELLRIGYPNLFRKYNTILVKARQAAGY